METTIIAYIGVIGNVLGLYWDTGLKRGSLAPPDSPCTAELLHTGAMNEVVQLCLHPPKQSREEYV